MLRGCYWLLIQPVDATHCSKRSAGVSKSNVSLRPAVKSVVATAFSRVLMDARQIHAFREVLPEQSVDSAHWNRAARDVEGRRSRPRCRWLDEKRLMIRHLLASIPGQ